MLKYIKPQINVTMFGEDVVLASRFEVFDFDLVTDDKYDWEGDGVL